MAEVLGPASPGEMQAVPPRRKPITCAIAQGDQNPQYGRRTRPGFPSGDEKALAFHVAADQALALWDGDSAVALAVVAAELATEIRLLHAAEIERALDAGGADPHGAQPPADPPRRRRRPQAVPTNAS